MLHLVLLENLKLALHVSVKLQDGRNVAAAVAVVWCGPDGDEILLGEHILVTLVHQLMRAADQLQAVQVVELQHGSY